LFAHNNNDAVQQAAGLTRPLAQLIAISLSRFVLKLIAGSSGINQEE